MATEPRLLTSDLFGLLEQVRRSVLRLAIVFAIATAVAYPLAPHLLHFLTRPLGARFCYVVILPVTLRFLLSFGGENIEAGISVSRYLSMSLGLSAACGITFELPLVTLILHHLGLLSVSFLTEHRRYAVLLGAIFTAIITPTPDAFTMSTLLLPMLALYEISIVLMRIAERRQKTRVTRV